MPQSARHEWAPRLECVKVMVMIFIKRTLLLSGAVLSFGIASAQTTSTAPSVLHVTRSSVHSFQNNIRVSTVWGTIGAEKLELSNYFGFQKTWVLKPGDYPVVLKKDETSDGKVAREYEVEVAPGKTVTFVLTGMEE